MFISTLCREKTYKVFGVGLEIFVWTVKYDFIIFVEFATPVCTVDISLKCTKPSLYQRTVLALKYFHIVLLDYEIYIITSPSL